MLKRDQARIARVLGRAKGVALLGFSISHASGAHPAESLAALLATWKKAFSTGSWFSTFRKTAGIVAWVRSIEFTFPRNGAHPHLHVAVVFDHEPRMQEILVLRQRWLDCASALGCKAHLKGQDARVVPNIERDRDSVAYYLTEQSAIRQARKEKGRTPGDLLHSFTETGDAADHASLMAFHDATRGKRKIAYSRGFDAV